MGCPPSLRQARMQRLRLVEAQTAEDGVKDFVLPEVLQEQDIDSIHNRDSIFEWLQPCGDLLAGGGI
jgi:hypothetical protein